MTDLKLDIAFWNYDRTRALSEGKVRIPGVDAKYHSGSNVAEIFRGMVADHRFDVAELGLTYFLRTFKGGESPFLAIPVFPVRSFRHSAIFVNAKSGINKPEDLNGKTIGELALYSHDAGIVPKGMLMEEFGFKPETCRWLIGGLDWPLKPIDFVPHTHPANVKVADVPAGNDLGAMLDAGEIDALISADPPKCIREHSPRVRRLFPDYEKVERDYYKRTGIFPIMHTVVIRRELLKEHPGIAEVVYKGFCDAKKAAEDKYRFGLIFNNMDTMFPWFSQLIEEDISVLGEDWWPYGIGPNRKALESVLRYHVEQGITDRQFSIEDIFVPELSCRLGPGTKPAESQFEGWIEEVDSCLERRFRSTEELLKFLGERFDLATASAGKSRAADRSDQIPHSKKSSRKERKSSWREFHG